MGNSSSRVAATAATFMLRWRDPRTLTSTEAKRQIRRDTEALIRTALENMKRHGVPVTGAVILNPMHDSDSDPEKHATAIPLGATGEQMDNVMHIYPGGRHNFPLPTVHERDW